MKNIFLLGLSACLTALWGPSSAQTTSNEKGLIHLAGQAELPVMPDRVHFNLNVYATDKSVSEAVKKLNLQVAQILQKLQSMGFTKDDCRTSAFQIQNEYDYNNMGSRPVLKGYRAEQHIKVSFANQPEKLNQMMAVFMADDKQTYQVWFYAEVSEKLRAETEQKLITLALADARTDAELIAKNTQQRIVRVRQVNYHVADQQPVMMPMTDMRNMKADMSTAEGASQFGNLRIDEVILSERITVMYDTEAVK